MTPNEKKVMAISSGSTAVVLILAFLLLKDCSGNAERNVNVKIQADSSLVKINNTNKNDNDLNCGGKKDTLVLNQEQLDKIIDAVSKRNPVSKPVPRDPAPRTAPKPAVTVPDNEVVINDTSKNSGNIVINNKESGTASNVVKVEKGSENSGNIVINNGGVVNVYPKDTLKKEVEKAKYDTVLVRRVIIHRGRIYYR